jgi:RNA polymerase sigma-70 factor (ECF subfamily)
MSDDEGRLIEEIRAGDSERYAEIVAKYENAVFHLALRLTGNHDDAWDVSQAAFVRAYRHLDRFDTSRRFFSWLYRIAYNAALDVISRRARLTELPEKMAAPTDAPDALALRHERDRQLQTALNALTFDQRLVVVLRHFLDLSYREMAEILEIEEKTVKSRLFSARRRLADLLRGEMEP